MYLFSHVLKKIHLKIKCILPNLFTFPHSFFESPMTEFKTFSRQFDPSMQPYAKKSNALFLIRPFYCLRLYWYISRQIHCDKHMCDINCEVEYVSRELNCFNQVRRRVPYGASTTPIRLTQNCTPTTPSVNCLFVYTRNLVAPRCASFIPRKDDRAVRDSRSPELQVLGPSFHIRLRLVLCSVWHF